MVANLMSKFDGSLPFGFRDMAFFMTSLFFFQKVRYKILTQFGILSPIVGCYQGSLRDCKSSVK